MKIAGSVSLITGAASGIGKELSLYFLKNGGKVFAVDVDENLGNNLVEICSKEYDNENIKFFQCDVSDVRQLHNAFEEAMSTFKKLDIVCNNAGIAGRNHEQLMNDIELEKNIIGKTINIILTAMIEGTYLGIHKMSKQKGGSGGVIINTSSLAGLFAAPYSPVYGAAKSGVTAFTHSFKYTENHSKDGIRVNCICPTFVDTPFLKQNHNLPTTFEEEHGFAAMADVVKAFVQCIEDDNLNGEAIAVLSKNIIKKVELPHPKSQI